MKGSKQLDNYRIMKNGIKQESTDYRPQNYSVWHRQLSKYCYAFDVDFVEYRINRGIVGIFEIKQFRDMKDLNLKRDYVISQSQTQIKIYRLLTSDTIYNAYFVAHTADMRHFEVWNISKDSQPIFTIFDEPGYKIWIEKL